MTDDEFVHMLETDPDSAHNLNDKAETVILNILRGSGISGLKGIEPIRNKKYIRPLIETSREDIEDCVSDIFVELFQHYKEFRSKAGTLKAFISTIAKRKAIDEYRKLSKKYIRSVSIDDENEDDFFTEDTPETNSAEMSEKRLIWDTIRNLGEPDSIILIQQFFYNKTVRETAQFLSMTAASVQKRSKRAREKLKNTLAEAGVTY